MSPENEALRRCERLLGLMDEAMRMERALQLQTAAADTSTHSLVKPIFEQALERLEPRVAPGRGGSVRDWIRELVDLELALDAALAQRGWRVLGLDAERGPIAEG